MKILQNNIHRNYALIALAVIVIASLVMYLLKPNHDYDVSSENIVSIEDYTHCVNLMLIDESSVTQERLKELSVGCNNIILTQPKWIRNTEGDYLIFVNRNDYYRVSPVLFKRITKQIKRIKVDNSQWFEQLNES